MGHACGDHPCERIRTSTIPNGCETCRCISQPAVRQPTRKKVCENQACSYPENLRPQTPPQYRRRTEQEGQRSSSRTRPEQENYVNGKEGQPRAPTELS